jgi:WD40 repeat protein
LIRELNGSKMEYRNIRWNRDGSQLATASDALRIWSKEGKLLYTAGKGDTVFWGVDWNYDSDNLVTVNFDTGAIQTWTDKGRLLKSLY